MKQYIVVDYITADKTKKDNEAVVEKYKRGKGAGKDGISNNCFSWVIRKFFQFFSLLYNLPRVDKIHAMAMIFIIVLSIVDFISIAGGIRNNKGFDINEDQGLDVD